MFIRIKPTNKNSPHKNVQICKSFRVGNKVRQKIIRHVGVARDESHLKELKSVATYLIQQLKEEHEGPTLFDLPTSLSEKPIEDTLDTALITSGPKLPVDLADLKEEKRCVEGFHDIFGKLFKELGFHQFLSKRPTKTLLDIIIARIANPASKRCSQEFLEAEFDHKIALDSIYNMMDLLFPHADAIQKNIYHATCSLFKEQVNIVLFDVTTLYFESIYQDELRDFGYSKDQKFHMTQVVLALASNMEGFPLGYKLFPGNTAEVSTLLQSLEQWKTTLPIGEIFLVADRAMMSEKNLQALEDANIKYVVAAKLKKYPKNIKTKILENQGTWIEVNKEKHCKQELTLSDNRRLIVTYSEKRAKKDREDRERILEKMQKRLGKSKNPKKLVTNRGYAKFIKADGEVKLSINEDKIAEESIWDGFHGIVTNDTTSKAEELLSRYRRLWVIEECFRIQKDDLAVRPIFHWKPERIQAHILICYMAFALVRHAEWRVQVQQKGISIRDIRKELQRVQASILKDNATGKRYYLPSCIGHKANKVYQAMGVKRNESVRELM
jgi:transposase